MSRDRKTAPGKAPGAAPAARRLVLGAATLIRWWALGGGLVVCGLAVMTAYSASSQVLFNAPFAPDYELSKHLMAIAIFMFLPYCQLTGANVTVDIFTERLSEARKALMNVLSALLALSFAVLLLRQMSFGFESYMQYPEVTPVLQLPLWTAFPPILLSLALLIVASLITLNDCIRVARHKRPIFEAGGLQVSE